MSIERMPVDEAIDAIRRCNADPTFLASDALMHQHFGSPQQVLDPVTVAERVVLLDAVWGTQMYWEKGGTNRVITAIQLNAPMMLSAVERLAEDALGTSPESVTKAADELLPVILNAPHAEGKGKQHYSFATKFLHWTTRVHFPVMDRRARESIRRLQRTLRIRDRIPAQAGDRPWRDDYPRWITFYSRLIGEMSPSERELLVEADWETHRSELRYRNTLLRIWDKVFYTLAD